MIDVAVALMLGKYVLSGHCQKTELDVAIVNDMSASQSYQHFHVNIPVGYTHAQRASPEVNVFARPCGGAKVTMVF